MNEKRFEEWMERYAIELSKAISAYPGEYHYGLGEVPIIAAKMRQAFIKGSFNKDGRAIKACCKAFGLKHTYHDIGEFLAADWRASK